MNEFPDGGVSDNPDAGNDSGINSVCIPCNVGHCPFDPTVIGVCLPTSPCLLFGQEVCNGHDDDCNGVVDDEPIARPLGQSTLCDDGVVCTFDRCTPVIFESFDGGVLRSAHCTNDPQDGFCASGATCSLGVCDPTGTTVATPPDTIGPDPRSGCLQILRNSWCTSVWDGCKCNGAELCAPGVSSDPSGCLLQPQPWLITSPPGSPTTCTQNLPCADLSKPCNNCQQQLCCEPAGTCNASHLGASGSPAVVAYCAAHPSEMCVGPMLTCPADGNACTTEICAPNPANGCVTKNIMGTTPHVDVFHAGPFTTTIRCAAVIPGAQGCSDMECVGTAGIVGPGTPPAVCTQVISATSPGCPVWDQDCARHGCIPAGSPNDSSDLDGYCGYFPSPDVLALCDDHRPCTLDTCDVDAAAEPFNHHHAGSNWCEHGGSAFGGNVGLCPPLTPGPFIDVVHRTNGCFQELCYSAENGPPQGSFPADMAGPLGCYFAPQDSLCADDGLACTQSVCSKFTPATPDGLPTLDAPFCWNVPMNPACGSVVRVTTTLPDGGIICQTPVCSAIGRPFDGYATPLPISGCWLDSTVAGACLL